ncbi:hypothetical protein KSP40_PGU017393 [Platanthera guangdongensis]|uniref:Uncharacterized protein n=1 Tax=Platanthera guangdongensis TaxID=2320717 RepID=A0ABR2MTA7_9ASPA
MVQLKRDHGNFAIPLLRRPRTPPSLHSPARNLPIAPLHSGERFTSPLRRRFSASLQPPSLLSITTQVIFFFLHSHALPRRSGQVQPLSFFSDDHIEEYLPQRLVRSFSGKLHTRQDGSNSSAVSGALNSVRYGVRGCARMSYINFSFENSYISSSSSMKGLKKRSSWSAGVLDQGSNPLKRSKLMKSDTQIFQPSSLRIVESFAMASYLAIIQFNQAPWMPLLILLIE